MPGLRYLIHGIPPTPILDPPYTGGGTGGSGGSSSINSVEQWGTLNDPIPDVSGYTQLPDPYAAMAAPTGVAQAWSAPAADWKGVHLEPANDGSATQLYWSKALAAGAIANSAQFSLVIAVKQTRWMPNAKTILKCPGGLSVQLASDTPHAGWIKLTKSGGVLDLGGRMNIASMPFGRDRYTMMFVSVDLTLGYPAGLKWWIENHKPNYAGITGNTFNAFGTFGFNAAGTIVALGDPADGKRSPDMEIGMMWFAAGSAIDFDVQANRDAFRYAGSIDKTTGACLGVTPHLFLNSDNATAANRVADWKANPNKGSLGALTYTSGTGSDVVAQETTGRVITDAGPTGLRPTVPIAKAIDAILVTNGGSGYTSAPTVVITGAGTGASARANISGGVVTSVDVLAGGQDYATASIAFSGGGGAGATATAQVSDYVRVFADDMKRTPPDATSRYYLANGWLNEENTCLMLSGNSLVYDRPKWKTIFHDTGFANPPRCNYSTGESQQHLDNGGTVYTVPAGGLLDIVITNPGMGYLWAPKVTVSGNGSQRATATLDKYGRVSSINIQNRGGGLAANPTVTIEAPHEVGGVQATASAVYSPSAVSYWLPPSLTENFQFFNNTTTGVLRLWGRNTASLLDSNQKSIRRAVGTDFISAMITTRDWIEMTPGGYLEVRMKIGRGVYPKTLASHFGAIYTRHVAVGTWGEHDLIEHLGSHPTFTPQTVHGDGGGGTVVRTETTEDREGAYHT